MSRSRARRRFTAASIAALFAGEAALAAGVEGRVRGPDGAPVVGAMVSFSRGDPIRSTTVFSDDEGRFRSPELEGAPAVTLRVRRIGFQDLREPLALEAGAGLAPLVERGAGLAPLVLTLVPETDPAAVAAQLPSNHWLALLLEKLEQPGQREEFVRQCTFCHQQGSAATRLAREDWQWEKILTLMARMGGGVSPALRAKLPDVFRAAYDPAHAVPRLTAGLGSERFAPPPAPEVRRAVIDEWELGGRASLQHDIAVHPDGRIYSVDMTQDRLYRLDPASGAMASFPLPRGDLPLGGVFGGQGQPLPSTANAHVGPHSLQVAPDGAIWATLALGNQLARFDPEREAWSTFALEEGFYPHTLRFDAKGRVWFTLAISNHVGRFDPRTQQFQTIRLPAASFEQALALRLLPAALWLARRVDLSGLASEGGDAGALPVPYGIDVAPDGGIWFSQLNQHKIGRIDPETLEAELIDTPFSAPRRLRFDSKGMLWIPGFSSSVVARFDPKTRAFESFELPIEPKGSETPYALHVDRRTDAVWICGTNSDSLIRFEPETRRFTVYPLPTRVTYTREIDFDAAGKVWTSNSNSPTWQVEGGFPRVLRLDPHPEARPATRVADGVR
jgi:streptogramin lyase